MPNAVISLHLAMNPHNLRAFHAYFKFFLHQQNKYQSYLLVLTESTQQVHLAAQELQNKCTKKHFQLTFAQVKSS